MSGNHRGNKSENIVDLGKNPALIDPGGKNVVADYPEVTLVPTIPVLENTLLLSYSVGGNANGEDELSDVIAPFPDHIVVSCLWCFVRHVNTDYICSL